MLIVLNLATDGAMSIEGGNWQMFAHMIEASGATIHLKTQVNRLKQLDNGRYELSYKTNSDEHSETVLSDEYDEVVLAAPKQFSDIEFATEPRHVPDEIPYVKLHVTLFTSKHTLAPQAFNLPPGQLVPQTVLTTLPSGERHTDSSDGVGSPGFFSISTLRPTMDTRDGKDQLEYLYKIFSHEPVNSTFFANILGLAPCEPEQEINAEDVSWVYRKVWDSYPYEYPRVTFEELKLDERLWYTSGIESFISTMETSSLMGMNVAKLIAEGWGQ